tara:strand:- start:22 stop:390 length:369 start_codon:yes stop_codon:yes gene_type:complete
MKTQVQAKIYDLQINEKFVDVVVKKKKGDNFFPICFVGFSNTIEQIKEQGIEKTDKVKIGFTLKSKKYTDRNGVERYSTSAIIDYIELLEKNASTQTEVIFVNADTGEVIEDANISNNYSNS